MINNLFHQELQNVESTIAHRLRQAVSPTLRSYSRWLTKNNGKLLRPRILFSCAYSLIPNPKQEQLTHAASAIELLHRSSLLHDDIIDSSPTRHGALSAWKRFDPHRALLLGDWVLAAAQQELAECESEHARIVIAKAFDRMCKGQLEQMTLRGSTISIRQYIRIIENKTAALFEASAEAAACISNLKYRIRARTAGRHFGIAYQLIDDLQDLLGDPKQTGKPLGQDIREKEKTLPLLYLEKEMSLQGKSLKAILTSFAKSKARIVSKKIAEDHIKAVERSRLIHPTLSMLLRNYLDRL